MAILRYGKLMIAAESLVPYSKSEPAIFKIGQLTPVKDLKLLIKDYPVIAKNALIILINISNDRDVLQSLITDSAFLESLLFRITNVKEPNANEMAMLLANMAKSDHIEHLLTLKRDAPLGLSTSPIAIDQLMDCFVKGAAGSYNPSADFDFLAYLFADLAKFPSGQVYFTNPRPYDTHHPLSKLLPFTTHPSLPRRLGAASTLKNTSFHLPAHPALLSPLDMNILPYLLLPLAGPETFSGEENDQLLEELQYLPEDKKRDGDAEILKRHLETLLLLTSTREGRERVRKAGTYLVVRECHVEVEDEGVREGCERLVQVLMRDEEGEEKGAGSGNMRALGVTGGAGGGRGGVAGRMVTQMEEEDEDDRIEEVL